MPRPRSLTHPAIAAAALAVIDRDGLDALTMRAIAAELGMGTMSLYRYVKDREEIERLVVDLIFRTVDPNVPQRASWRQQVTDLVGRARAAGAAHPAVIPLILAHHQSSPAAWRWSEAVLGALTRAGLTGQWRVSAFRCLQAYVLGVLQTHSFMPLTGAGNAALAALSPADHPLLVETALDAFAVTPEQEFGEGLAILLDGLEARFTKTTG
jgi:AcrR family transcriptional regulator